MTRELDRRDFTVDRSSAARHAELNAIANATSRSLEGPQRVTVSRLDPLTGNPSRITSGSGPAEKGNYVERALDHVQRISRVLGLAPAQAAEFVADPHVLETTSGATTVHLQQHYKSIPIFQATEAVRFDPHGRLESTVGRPTTVRNEIDANPRLPADEAVKLAAAHIAQPDADEIGQKDPYGEPLMQPSVDVSGFEPVLVASFTDRADRAQVFESGPFGDKIRAHLSWFPLVDDLRLAWNVVIAMPDYRGQYRILVDSENGEILYCKQLIQAVAARGNVFLEDGSGPRTMVDFPRPLAALGLPLPPLPPGFPDDWVSNDRSEGNSVRAHLGSSGPSIQGGADAGVLTFDPADPKGDDQKVLNIFYYNNFMHDYFYLLGFREGDGNFQVDNFGRGGVSSDRVDARAHSGPVFGTANMGTPIDGSAPVMNMGLVSSTNRHTAFDASVVFHEFMHGVTNRLVGGPLNVEALEQSQSGGMGEGWGDYIACTILGTNVVGSWVVDNPAGIRDFPYTSNFPDNFGDLGTGRYTQVHNIGEIWCATLLEMNRELGDDLGVRLVVDALKLAPANPSFLDMRDAILTALDGALAAGDLTQTEHAAARTGIWRAFAHFGMGPGAHSNGAGLSGIVADFQTPPTTTGSVSVEATPNLAIPDDQPAGVASVLHVDQNGRIAAIEVGLEIEHTFIGDLRVELLSPGGVVSTLHNRSGGGAENLIETYRSDASAELAILIGEPASGDWTLRVSDRAGLDVGTLRFWRMTLDLESATDMVRVDASPALVIPDNDPAGISSTLHISRPGAAAGLKVGLDITHPFIGDLRVEIAAPSGNTAVLHNRGGGDADNLIGTLDSLSLATLAGLVGEGVDGNWVLRVADLAGRDVGKLNKWSLEVTL